MFPGVRRLLICILFTIISLTVKSQDANAYRIFSDSLKDCRELQYQSMQLIPLYYENRNFDTAYALLNNWSGKCPLDETIFRSRVLFAIDNGTFSDTLYKNENFSYFLDVYKELANDSAGSSLYYYPDYVEEIELLTWYKTFTDTIAARCLTYSDLSPDERFFASYYMHPSDSVYLLLKGKEYGNSMIKKLVTAPLYGEVPKTQAHYSMSAGMWLPNQHLEMLGMHPFIGGQLGLKHERYLADLSLDLRFGESPKVYQVVVDGDLHDTQNFFELSARLDFGYEMFRLWNTELLFLGGIGYDHINAYYEANDPDDETDDVNKYLHSFNLNIGGSYRIYLRNSHYLAFTGKYHRLNFRNKGGTDLKGNAATLSLEYGLGMNRWINDRNTILREKIGSN